MTAILFAASLLFNACNCNQKTEKKETASTLHEILPGKWSIAIVGDSDELELALTPYHVELGTDSLCYFKRVDTAKYYLDAAKQTVFVLSSGDSSYTPYAIKTFTDSTLDVMDADSSRYVLKREL